MNCCGNSKFAKYVWILIALVALTAMTVSLSSCAKKEIGEPSSEEGILYYTCGMHPSVRISPEEYNEDVLCPICNMKLVPVYEEKARAEEEVFYGCGVDTEGECPHCDLNESDEECICGGHSFVIKDKMLNCPVCRNPLKELTPGEVDKLKGVVSRVKIKDEQARLAGVRTEPVKRLHLYKEIRTAGKVAYDPKLAIAQEEFISTLEAFDKIKQGEITEIKERTERLLESSKRKLKLLGLSDEQIEKLSEERKVQRSLVLPEEKMWIYGDVYEYELMWVKAGAEVKVTTSGVPGEEFGGIISSVNPVLDPKTRAVRFRAEVDNPELKLKPEMYVDVIIRDVYKSPEGEHMVLAIPRDAVLDTGIRKIVWVDKGNEEYEGREVRIGPEATSQAEKGEARFYPVLRGLREGEWVVVKANFLIDSQSQLTGVAAGAYGGALGAEEDKSPPPQSQQHQH